MVCTQVLYDSVVSTVRHRPSYLAESVNRCLRTAPSLFFQHDNTYCFVHSTIVRFQSPSPAGRETICQSRSPSVDNSTHSCTEWCSFSDNRVGLAVCTPILKSTFLAYWPLCVNCHCSVWVFSSVNHLQDNTQQPSCHAMWKLCADLFLSTVFLPRCIFAGRSWPQPKCPSVRPSVCHTRELWQNARNSAKILTPHERTIIPVLPQEKSLAWDDSFYLKFWVKLSRWSKNTDFQSIIALSASAVAPSEKVQLSLMGNLLHAFQWASDEQRTLPISSQRGLTNAKWPFSVKKVHTSLEESLLQNFSLWIPPATKL